MPAGVAEQDTPRQTRRASFATSAYRHLMPPIIKRREIGAAFGFCRHAPTLMRFHATRKKRDATILAFRRLPQAHDFASR